VILDYAPLDDTHDIKRRIDSLRIELGIDGVDTNGFVCFATSAGPAPIEIVEFYNFWLGHYFITADKAEIASIDNGEAGLLWSRTGERFTGYEADACSRLGVRNPMPLFRFYGTRGVGPNSHFFTADRSECGKVRHDPGWSFEGVPFRVWTPVAGQCPAKSLPIRRLYNGRAAQNDSNHRYASRRIVVDAMVAAGWIDEGVTLCIPQP
jgi:serine protease